MLSTGATGGRQSERSRGLRSTTSSSPAQATFVPLSHARCLGYSACVDLYFIYYATSIQDSLFKIWDVREPRICLRSHRIRSTWGNAIQWINDTSIQISGDQGSIYHYDIVVSLSCLCSLLGPQPADTFLRVVNTLRAEATRSCTSTRRSTHPFGISSLDAAIPYPYCCRHVRRVASVLLPPGNCTARRTTASSFAASLGVRARPSTTSTRN